MALTKTILCNLALSKIGNEGNQITDYDADTGKSARQCRLHYDQTLDELVRMHTWNCAIVREKLDTDEVYPAVYDSPADDDYVDADHVPTTLSGYKYYAPLPDDYIRILRVSNTSTDQYALKYQIDWSVERGYLLSNYEDNFCVYTIVPTPAVMDSMFAMSFYTLLASKLAVPVAGDRELEQKLMGEFYQVVLPEARRINGFEGNEQEIIHSDWMDATYSRRSAYNAPFSSSSYGVLPY